jgi:hypothetical protein
MQEYQPGQETTTPADEPSKAEEVKDSMSDLANHLTEYARTFYKLQILKMTRKATQITSNIVGLLVSVFIGIFVLLFASVALAFWLGTLVNSTALGFLMVAGLYLAAGLIFMSVRKKMIFPIWRDRIIRKFYEQEN